ncbi:MAG: LAGLIDADG family homing endonuclease [Nitrososphaerota archaeon]
MQIRKIVKLKIDSDEYLLNILNAWNIAKWKYLPLEMRMKMYNDVIELRNQGLSYKEIQRKIYEKYGMRLSKPLIHYWIHKKHSPFGKLNKFDEKPSSELAYVIGTILSDGYKCFDDKYYRFYLNVKDKEFAEEFGKCLAKVLGRKEPYKPFWNEEQKQWRIIGCGVLLYRFLDRPLEELKPYIEYSKDTASAFLRALFDGEGSMHKYRRELYLYNTDIKLLNYTKHLLKQHFNINTTGPNLAVKSGKVTHFPNGKIIKTTKNCYYLYVHANSLLNFYKYIGFTIKRKQQRLIKAIQ